jgi:hypothetical protein
MTFADRRPLDDSGALPLIEHEGSVPEHLAVEAAHAGCNGQPGCHLYSAIRAERMRNIQN